MLVGSLLEGKVKSSLFSVPQSVRARLLGHGRPSLVQGLCPGLEVAEKGPGKGAVPSKPSCAPVPCLLT